MTRVWVLAYKKWFHFTSELHSDGFGGRRTRTPPRPQNFSSNVAVARASSFSSKPLSFSYDCGLSQSDKTEAKNNQ
jgi:hypothetical protein